MTTKGTITHADLMALPPTVGLDVANKVLGMGRTAGYALAKRGDYPVRLLPGGSGYRVSRYDLYRYLGVAEDGRTGNGTA
ncbi:integrase [Streptomyces sp. NPDC057235]|uniref:integrase n=1 Tax=Streptomyces sp. NPDC057235 TaxID=3346058 RepID=UPI003632E946